MQQVNRDLFVSLALWCALLQWMVKLSTGGLHWHLLSYPFNMAICPSVCHCNELGAKIAVSKMIKRRVSVALCSVLLLSVLLPSSKVFHCNLSASPICICERLAEWCLSAETFDFQFQCAPLFKFSPSRSPFSLSGIQTARWMWTLGEFSCAI